MTDGTKRALVRWEAMGRRCAAVFVADEAASHALDIAGFEGVTGVRVEVFESIDVSAVAPVEHVFREGDGEYDKLRYDLHRHVRAIEAKNFAGLSITDAVTDALDELRRRGLLRRP